jgi:GGDEF domain-containing protein
MSKLITASRRTDAVISVTQDNQAKTLTIINMNMAAERLLSLYNKEINNKSFYDIISQPCRQDIESYIEFEAGGNDLAAILNRMRDFYVITRDGTLVPVSVKAFYTYSHSKNPTYELLFRDISLYEKIEQMKKQLKEKRIDSSAVNEESGIMGKVAFLRSIEIVAGFVNEHPVEACLSMMEIKNYGMVREKYGPSAVRNFVKGVIERYNKATRAEDIIGYVSEAENRFGIILFNCSYKDAIIVLNRIKARLADSSMAIDSHNKIIPEIALSYGSIGKNVNIGDLITACERSL